MEETKIGFNNGPKLTNIKESHQSLLENDDASDYESINSDQEDTYGKEPNSDYESDSLQNIERQEGDGQESIPSKKVDDDEDKKNPQYIPKRGTFYEHDDRTLEESEEESTETDKKDRQNKKSIWIEKKERWGHDRFIENDQVPKSRSELIGIYGYDIRNEEGPPRARRRRRYGRGPNKYTRTWEDEDAYKPVKPVKTFSKKSNDSEEYPPLERHDEDSKDTEEKREIVVKEVETKPAFKETNRPLVISNGITKPIENAQQKIEITPSKPTENVTAKPVIIQPKEIKTTDYRGFTKVRQFKNSNFEQKILRKQDNPQITENLAQDIANMSIAKKPSRQTNIPPRLQNEQKAPKRYSSLRQRPLPETAASTAVNQQPYYANDYTPPQPQQAILSQPPASAVLQQIAPTIQQVPVTATALLPTPTQFVPAFQPPPGFIPATVAASPFITPQPQLINYVPNQPPQYAQAQFQGFQHQQFNPVTAAAAAAELNYQCQGGTTYYSTQNQHLGHVVPLQPRPKAAIPIIPPPLQESLDRTNNSFNTSFSGTEDDKEYNDFYEHDYEDTNIVIQ